MRPSSCPYGKDQGHLQKKRLIWGLRFQSRWWQSAGSRQLAVPAAARAHILNPRQEAESANWETSKSAPSAINWGSCIQSPQSYGAISSKAELQVSFTESQFLLWSQRGCTTHRGHPQRASTCCLSWSRGLTLSQPLAGGWLTGSCPHRLHQPHLLELVKHTNPATSI